MSRANERRRGRPPAGEEDARRNGALDAALAELVERGYEATTMLGVARRARSSKESLYSWFGNKEGLFAAIIRRESENTNRSVAALLEADIPPAEALKKLATNLLRLLTGERSLAINRAAMTSPALALLLLQHGRHTTGPLVERYLERLAEDGVISVADPAEAFQLFYGLVIQDFQIRALLGQDPPDAETAATVANRAVGAFLTLASPR